MTEEKFPVFSMYPLAEAFGPFRKKPKVGGGGGGEGALEKGEGAGGESKP